MVSFKALVAAAAVAVLPAAVSATVGGDLAFGASQSAFECAKSNGWEFAIVRSYHSSGAPDREALPTLNNAKNAGIAYRDVYHFPCAGQSGYEQISNDVSAVGRGNFGTMWLDIEYNPSRGCQWSTDLSRNCQLVKDMVSAAESLGVKVGIYSSIYNWGKYMGASCTAGAGKPLWYAHYDRRQTFDDFRAFGPWTRPSIKQYWDSVGICGISADADWF